MKKISIKPFPPGEKTAIIAKIHHFAWSEEDYTLNAPLFLSRVMSSFTRIGVVQTAYVYDLSGSILSSLIKYYYQRDLPLQSFWHELSFLEISRMDMKKLSAFERENVLKIKEAMGE